ncbi:odorant receptor Or1 [Tribolium castaneum]|uniref:odorant receptor Or1 n=1 Tax=Tribolium castaneum TaxID=7070 RepID=UPI0001C0C71F|nr:PREDICTED: odorant receptor Or1 [Tribolium castaneum]|eukprot:XP_015834341.1 PREDICTED: odorant receptor Or1 [Tribolium castaneum]
MAKTGDIFPVRDPVKRCLFIPKLLLESTNFWPEKRNFLTKFANWVMLIICVLIESGQIAFVVVNIKDITKIASAMSTVSTTFQAITKLTVLYIYNDKLRLILKSVWYEFWPSYTAGREINTKLETYNKIVIVSFLTILISGICFAFGFLSSPLISGERILPFETVYPFDWTKSPYYEIIYVTEWMTNIAFILIGICGHDFLFMGLCSNVVGQFTLLRELFGYLGTKNVAQIIKKLGHDTNIEPNRQLLRICIIHHVRVTEICKEIAEIFSFSCFIQLLSSVTALCVGALIMTFADIDAALFTVSSAYIVGHLLQLFLYATLGNEVIYYASRLPNAIFHSHWYNIDLEVKKDILFVLQRAQKEVKISAMGVSVLDYQTFIQVLRLSFSFYTMLSKVTDH